MFCRCELRVRISCVDGRSRYMYVCICSKRIPAHLRFAQCSILLHLIDIFFQSCIFYGRYRYPDLFVCCCGTRICHDIPHLYKE